MLSYIKNIVFQLFINFGKSKERSRAMGYGNFTNVECVSVYDGDTIKVNIKDLHPLVGKGITIRINGIDTPEMKGGCEKSKIMAKEAKSVVQNILTAAKKIDLLNCKRGKYFRIVADVIADNINIGNLLLVKGLAVKYDGSTKKQDWCK